MPTMGSRSGGVLLDVCSSDGYERGPIERSRQWYRDGVDVQALLPTLSVYLGHLRPQERYWSLTATPELLTAAAARFQRYAMEGENR